MNDYSAAITALIVVTVVISTAVVYVLAQPTDLPRYKEQGSIEATRWVNTDRATHIAPQI